VGGEFNQLIFSDWSLSNARVHALLLVDKNRVRLSPSSHKTVSGFGALKDRVRSDRMPKGRGRSKIGKHRVRCVSQHLSRVRHLRCGRGRPKYSINRVRLTLNFVSEMSSKSKNALSFFYWNCCGGIQGKMNTVLHIIDTLDPTILFVSEAEYKSTFTWIYHKDYDTIATKCEKFGKSRLICFVKKNSGFRVSKTIVPDDLEIILLESKDCQVGGIYRPFKNVNNNTPHSYFEKAIETLKSFNHPHKLTYVGGDFNINWNLQGNLKEELDDWALQKGLSQRVTANTWQRIIKDVDRSVMRKSMLDLIFTDDETSCVTIHDNYTSDHSLISVTSSILVPEIVRNKILLRDWRKYHPHSLRERLENCLAFPIDMDSNSTIDALTISLSEAYDALCPLRSIRTSRPDDIIDQTLEKMKKRRKRLRKEFNKNSTSERMKEKLARKINGLNVAVKIQINTSRKHQIRTKMEGANPKSFWNCISNLEGKNKKSQIKLKINDVETTSDEIIAEAFAGFFANKVETLSENYGKNDYRSGFSKMSFSSKEVLEAAKQLKPKLCAGEDQLPMRLIKDLAMLYPEMIAHYYSALCYMGMPTRWKTAIITPLHKSGAKDQLTQYRPISNLDSLSKLFEKLLLNRLELLGELDGKHQHGFKKQRSTTTAMLEVQHFVATNLDQGKIVGTYSLDLSAAFDLLRPDVFYHALRPTIHPDLLNPIMDFLSFRNFQVQVGKQKSQPRDLKVGCVQGSILGPRLFTLYMKNITHILGQDTHVVSYADDTYVSIARKNADELRPELERLMTIHDDFLCSVGMKTNVAKTELIYFSRNKTDNPPSIVVKGTEIKPADSMKILGIKFQENMGWDTHFIGLKQKARVVFSKLRYLQKLLDIDAMRKVVTTHYFGMIYYASQLWLNELTTSKQWKIINSLHYKALRVSLGDFRNKISKKNLNDIFGRATPVQWMAYSNAKMAISLHNFEDGPPLSEILRHAAYRNDRLPGQAIYMDSSRLRIGKNSLVNRLNCMRQVKFQWTNGINQHALRQNLKKTFYLVNNQ